MKRIMTFALALTVAAALCACSGNTPPKPGTSGEAGATADIGNGTGSPVTEAGTAASHAPVAGSEGLEIREYDDENMMVTGSGGFAEGGLVIPSYTDGKPVIKIDEDAFCETGITSLTVPWTVQWIGEDAFEGCGKLTSVTLAEGLVTIGESAFSGCKELKGLTVPSTVEHVGRSSFRECLSLKEVTFTGGASVGSYAFAGCRSLKNVVFNGTSSVPYSIASEAFYGASGLESATFSEGLTEIGNYCFEYCSSLKTLYLPKSLTSVGPSAFYGVKLEKICYAGSEDDWNAISVGADNDTLKNAEIVYNFKK